MKRFLTGISKEDIGSSKYQQIMEAMKEYAEFYAKKCLEAASNNVQLHQQWVSEDGSESGYFNLQPSNSIFNGTRVAVDPSSIKNITLPEHE